ncbi:MAG: FHA domain-containing protein [Desulfobacteraceae bacterium]|nr:FHA domain-containing protein [Desulfobacteraceae bacterium]
MPQLQITSNDGRRYNFPIDKEEVSIGRSKNNDIILRDNTVSRNHAGIMMTNEGYLLTDFGSYNGIEVNKKPIQSIVLKHDDQIKIGTTKMTFLTQEEAPESLADSVEIILEPDTEKDDQEIVESSPEDSSQKDSHELLVSSFKPTRISRESDLSVPSEEESQPSEIRAGISSLERMNKVLFVLYEVSKQLNSILDLHELLNKIMDLIFMVIDADYGFLILTGEEENGELIPVVVKYRDDKERDRRELKASQTIINKVINDKVALLTSNAMKDTRLDHGESLVIQQIRSAICVPLWKKDTIIGVIQLDGTRPENQFTEDDLELLKTIGSQMAIIIDQASLNEQIREEERMRNRLERFHSPQVIEMILQGGQEAKDNIMEPKELNATILFSDIIGFTTLSEQMPPREINMILNYYFSRMTDIVFEYDGTLDKYMGDSLMAVFGAPMEKEGDAERAILAALNMRRELAVMMEKLRAERRFNIRIGINTGRVLAGNIGSPQRMDYTVIGDPVNIASRLESLAQPNQILIGEETYRLVKGKFNVKRFGPQKVRGKRSEIVVYEVLD